MSDIYVYIYIPKKDIQKIKKCGFLYSFKECIENDIERTNYRERREKYENRTGNKMSGNNDSEKDIAYQDMWHLRQYDQKNGSSAQFAFMHPIPNENLKHAFELNHGLYYAIENASLFRYKLPKEAPRWQLELQLNGGNQVTADEVSDCEFWKKIINTKLDFDKDAGDIIDGGFFKIPHLAFYVGGKIPFDQLEPIYKYE